jgi:hypothetical protein
MAYVGEYKTYSGRSYFRWSFEKQNNGEIRAYILSAPGYGNRPSGGHSTHRYEDNAGDCYICYEPMPTNLQDAIAIAKEWAECTEEYILYSQEF